MKPLVQLIHGNGLDRELVNRARLFSTLLKTQPDQELRDQRCRFDHVREYEDGAAIFELLQISLEGPRYPFLHGSLILTMPLPWYQEWIALLHPLITGDVSISIL